MTSSSSYSPEILNELLPIYYKRLFPYESFCKWLGAGNIDKTYLGRREFSFTLQDDIYIRYQSFSNCSELQREMLKRVPHKIDIGAVYNAKPSDHKKFSNFQPLEKELVLDIDLTDYDDIRTCCSGASICHKCWQFMTVALRVLDRALREDFGFQHLLWVYSGRRGIHCWVSDPQAKKLGQAARSAVAEYLQILTGGDQKIKKVTLKSRDIHPMITKSLGIIKEKFEKLCLVDQDILGTPERWDKVLSLIPDEDLRRTVALKMPECSDSVKRWNMMNTLINEYVTVTKPDRKQRKTTDHILKEIMLQFSYPRLDIAVSKGINHLLKSPFVVHPKTGRVCVPIDPFRAESFDPFAVPTISQLTNEIDKFDKEESNKNVKQDYKKTSLREPLQVFNEFLSKLGETWKGKMIENSDAQMEF
jgi:DNA primase small subunit